MISLYTDEARLKRYDKLLKQKEKCDFWLGKCLLISLVTALTESVGNLLTKPMAGALRGKLVTNGWTPLIVTLVMGLCVFSIALRNYRLMLAALTGVVVCLTLGFYTTFQIGAIQILPLSIGLRYGIMWAKLKIEEGFPRFKIDIEEHEVRTKSQTGYIEQRALEAGVRQAQEALDPHAQMTDLMDSDAETQFLGAQLHRYHERSRRGIGAVILPEQHDEKMDKVKESEITDILEEI